MKADWTRELGLVVGIHGSGGDVAVVVGVVCAVVEFESVVVEALKKGVFGEDDRVICIAFVF